MRIAIAVVGAGVLIGFGACRKRAGSELFGAKVTPPGVLAQIRPGMTLDELRAIAPDLREDDGRGYLLASPASDAKLYAILLDGRVTHTYVDLDGSNGRALVEEAWGPPDAEPDRDHTEQPAWRSARTGWRATLFCGHGTATTPIPPFCTISFHPHKPLDAMFGATIAPAGELASAAPDMPEAQLAAVAHYPLPAAIRWLDYDGAVEHVTILEHRLSSVAYALPALARPMIAKAWGPGVAEGDATVWFDANSRWTARAKPDDHGRLWLELVGYLPFDKTVELLDAFAHAKTYADAVALHPELVWSKQPHETGRLLLPYNEMMSPSMRVLAHTVVGVFRDDSPMAFVVTELDPKKNDAIVAALTARWGTPKQTRERHDDERVEVVTYAWPGHGMLRSDAEETSLHVEAR